MKRRNFFGAAIAGVAGLFGLSKSQATAKDHSVIGSVVEIEPIGPRMLEYCGMSFPYETPTHRLENLSGSENFSGQITVTVAYKPKSQDVTPGRTGEWSQDTALLIIPEVP